MIWTQNVYLALQYPILSKSLWLKKEFNMEVRKMLPVVESYILTYVGSYFMLEDISCLI